MNLFILDCGKSKSKREEESARQVIGTDADINKVRVIHISQVSNIESDNSQNVGLEDHNYIFDRIFPYFTTSSIKITLEFFFQILMLC